MINDKKTDRWFWPQMSHVKRGDATHTRVTPFKMVWVILAVERCGGTDQIDLAPDVHIKISHVMYTNVTTS
jgi:hypothetical protein